MLGVGSKFSQHEIKSKDAPLFLNTITSSSYELAKAMDGIWALQINLLLDILPSVVDSKRGGGLPSVKLLEGPPQQGVASSRISGKVKKTITPPDLYGQEYSI